MGHRLREPEQDSAYGVLVAAGVAWRERTRGREPGEACVLIQGMLLKLLIPS